MVLAASVPSRAEFLDIVRNLARPRGPRLGVDVKTSVDVDAELLLAERPDVVVLATGAKPAPAWWAAGHPRVVDVRDVLEEKAAPTGQVLVFDELGFHQATSLAELLADRGCAVELATNGMVVGQDLGVTLDMETWNVKADAKGITQTTDVVIRWASSPTTVTGGVVVTLLHHTTGDTLTRRCDWVVCAVHASSGRRALARVCATLPFPVHRIGDCLTPRRAHAAVIEGERVAVAL